MLAATGGKGSVLPASKVIFYPAIDACFGCEQRMVGVPGGDCEAERQAGALILCDGKPVVTMQFDTHVRLSFSDITQQRQFTRSLRGMCRRRRAAGACCCLRYQAL